jgi:hypothetical protein
MKRLTHYEDGIPYAIDMDVSNLGVELHIRGPAITRLAEYEDAEEQGRVVVLPCRPGEKVYIISAVSNEIFAATVFGISKCGDNDFLLTDLGSCKEGSFGKTWFLKREEAEAALDAMETAVNDTLCETCRASQTKRRALAKRRCKHD